MSTSQKLHAISPEPILRSKEEWLQINPFLTDEEVEKLSKRLIVPVTKRMLDEDHDSLIP